jgi:hypothetical protein
MLNKKKRRLESGGSFSQQRLIGVEQKQLIVPPNQQFKPKYYAGVL